MVTAENAPRVRVELISKGSDRPPLPVVHFPGPARLPKGK